MAVSTARSRYNRAVLACGIVYAAALFNGTGYFRHHPGGHGAVAYLTAIAPALPIIAMFVALGRYLVAERDEYVRLLMVRQTLIATGLALSLATVWGFLESFDLAPHIDSYFIAVVWFGGLGFGACVNKLVSGRYA